MSLSLNSHRLSFVASSPIARPRPIDVDARVTELRGFSRDRSRSLGPRGIEGLGDPWEEGTRASAALVEDVEVDV